MRLINADELKERISIDSDLVEVDDGVMVPCIDFEYNIDFAPTIEAISIEWIEEWKKGKTSIEQVVADKIMMDYIHRD